MKRAEALVVTLVLVLAACGGDDDDKSATASSTTTATTAEPSSTTETTAAQKLIPIADIPLTLTEIVQLEQPVDMAVRSGQTGFFFAEKTGRVQFVGDDEKATILDLSGEVSDGNEQGLLGIAFAPDGTKLYAYYTNRDGDSRLDEYEMEDGPQHAIVESRREMLAVDQPFPNHNGGGLLFGPDGMLYLGLGDGGAGGDPNGNGQNADAILGKILRFDPAAPERPERYAIGMRNPWRFSFDRENGDLWVGDVGQDEWEEVDRIPAGTPAGVNLGWNLLEGTHPYEGDAGGVQTLAPVYEYGHDSGQSVVGGYVYRGTKIPQLQGTYLFADTYAGPIRALRQDSGSYVTEDTALEVPGGQPVSFGEDADGELYVIALSGGVYRIDPA